MDNFEEMSCILSFYLLLGITIRDYQVGTAYGVLARMNDVVLLTIDGVWRGD